MKKENKLFMQMGEYSRVVVDNDGQFWQEFRFPRGHDSSSSLFGLNCRWLCGYDLKRVHAGCLVCRLRRAWLGKMPSRIQVRPYIVFARQDSSYGRLFSFVASVLEILANI
jgi:hypothetical protein